MDEKRLHERPEGDITVTESPALIGPQDVSEDLELIRGDGGEYLLRVGKQEPFALDPAALYKLAVIGVEARTRLPRGLSFPPYVIWVELPYTDYDPFDQTTVAYHQALKTNDRALAGEIETAIQVELDRAGSGYGTVEIPDFPQDRFDVGCLDEVTSVAGAVRVVRSDLVVHGWDRIEREIDYWEGSGFQIKPDREGPEAGVIETVQEVIYDSHTGADCCHPDFAAELDNYIAKHPDMDWSEPWVEKLKRWSRGLDPDPD